MLVSKAQFESYFTKICVKTAIKKSKMIAACTEINEKYNIPIERISDIISGRISFLEFNDFILYAIVSVIDERNVDKYFTQLEIETYSKTRFEEQGITLPLEFEVKQVNHDHWTGVISSDELEKLANAGMIYYNPDTQRTMKQVRRGQNIIYVPHLNQAAVREIEKLMAKGDYISDDITLNMPDGTDFEYKDGKLIIRDIDKFDIIDGYHRYVAIMNTIHSNVNFSINMELRIVNFTQEKAKQFIFQKDQKTKMRKMDSKTYDLNDVANLITQRLNEDPSCDLYGKINNNEGIVSAAVFSFLVRRDIVGEANKDNKKVIPILTRQLKQGINILVEEYPELMEKKWNSRTIFAVVWALSKNRDFVADYNFAIEKIKDVHISELTSDFKRTKSRLDTLLES